MALRRIRVNRVYNIREVRSLSSVPVADTENLRRIQKNCAMREVARMKFADLRNDRRIAAYTENHL
jgi:hypothetical protein